MCNWISFRMNLSLITFALVISATNAFVVHQLSNVSSSPTTLNMKSVSRRQTLKQVATTVGALSILPSISSADVTNKIASQASLRYIKRSIKEFESIELAASTDNYTEIKTALRNQGLSEIRQNARVLIRGGEDGPESENLVAAYSSFIKELESLDSQAFLGIRGRKISMYPYYEKSMKALVNFEEVAERAIAVPLQET